MKKTVAVFCIILAVMFGFPGSQATAAAPCGPNTCQVDSSIPYCEPCAPYPAPCGPPCAPACGANCGVSLCAVGVAVAAVIAAGAIILLAGKTEHAHSH